MILIKVNTQIKKHIERSVLQNNPTPLRNLPTKDELREKQRRNCTGYSRGNPRPFFLGCPLYGCAAAGMLQKQH